jgi:uncharacterized protein (DUF2267 family)
MDYAGFIARVAERSGIERDRAQEATDAVLQTLAARISRKEAEDLAAQLPGGLQPLLRDKRGGERFGPDEFAERVALETGLDREGAQQAIRAVFATLEEAVSGGEFSDIVNELPRDYDRLVAPPAT